VIELFRAARVLQADLDTHGWRFCFIGGIALQHWGEPRVTRDLDLSIFTGFGGEEPVVDGLLAAYAPRIGGARAFALEHRVLLLSMPDGPDVDVALAGLPFESDMIDRAVMAEIAPAFAIRICAAEDLFVMKAFADRAQDRADVLGIARRTGRQLDWNAILDRLAPLAEAKEEPGLLDGVRALRDEFAR
jgi:hypothetical protein